MSSVFWDASECPLTMTSIVSSSLLQPQLIVSCHFLHFSYTISHPLHLTNSEKLLSLSWLAPLLAFQQISYSWLLIALLSVLFSHLLFSHVHFFYHHTLHDYSLSQLCHGPVVTYCMVYHYTKRVTLARLLANEGPAIYVVHLNRYFCYTSMMLFSSHFL